MDFIHIWYMHPSLTLIIMGVFGLLVGSFLNVVIYRLPLILLENPQTETTKNPFSLWYPYSYCIHCRQTLTPWMNIPILSFLLLGGKCHYCKGRIHINYPLVELISFLSAITLTLSFGPCLKMLAALMFISFVTALTCIDLATKQLPDQMTLSLLWIGLWFNTQSLFVPLSDAVLGAIFGYLFFFLIAVVYKKIRKREGIGHGDFKLLASLGAWFGWQALALIVFLASFFGSIISLIYLLSTKQSFASKIPFGPFLMMASLIILLGEKFMYDCFAIYKIIFDKTSHLCW